MMAGDLFQGSIATDIHLGELFQVEPPDSRPAVKGVSFCC